jgi:hypothetical protein
MKLPHAPKTVKTDAGYLHFWYANNTGRGSSNCTIILSSSPDRASMSAKQSEVISSVQTSAWAGKVNFSKTIQKSLGV